METDDGRTYGLIFVEGRRVDYRYKFVVGFLMMVQPQTAILNLRGHCSDGMKGDNDDIVLDNLTDSLSLIRR